MENKEILNIKELSKWIHTSESKIRQLIYKNEIPHFSIGNRHLFYRKAICQLIIKKHNDIDIGITENDII